MPTYLYLPIYVYLSILTYYAYLSIPTFYICNLGERLAQLKALLNLIAINNINLNRSL